eukprot:COSAG01_NODE_4849_length_4684_cov_12.227263_4_plen_152_part_00
MHVHGCMHGGAIVHDVTWLGSWLPYCVGRVPISHSTGQAGALFKPAYIRFYFSPPHPMRMLPASHAGDGGACIMQAEAGLLLGSDLTYFPAVFEILASTLRALAGPGTRKSEFLCFVETRQHERKPLGGTVLPSGGHYVCCMYVCIVRPSI